MPGPRSRAQIDCHGSNCICAPACHEDGYPDLGLANVYRRLAALLGGVGSQVARFLAVTMERVNFRLIGMAISPLRRVGFPPLGLLFVFRNNPFSRILIGPLLCTLPFNPHANPFGTIVVTMKLSALIVLIAATVTLASPAAVCLAHRQARSGY